MEGLNAMYAAPNNEISMMFDGGGKHELRIRQTIHQGPPGKVFCSTWNGNSWNPRTIVESGMASPNGMAMADHHGTLVGVHRGLGACCT